MLLITTTNCYAVSPLRGEKAINFAGAETYPAKPVAGTDEP